MASLPCCKYWDLNVATLCCVFYEGLALKEHFSPLRLFFVVIDFACLLYKTVSLLLNLHNQWTHNLAHDHQGSTAIIGNLRNIFSRTVLGSRQDNWMIGCVFSVLRVLCWTEWPSPSRGLRTKFSNLTSLTLRQSKYRQSSFSMNGWADSSVESSSASSWPVQRRIRNFLFLKFY